MHIFVPFKGTIRFLPGHIHIIAGRKPGCPKKPAIAGQLLAIVTGYCIADGSNPPMLHKADKRVICEPTLVSTRLSARSEME